MTVYILIGRIDKAFMFDKAILGVYTDKDTAKQFGEKYKHELDNLSFYEVAPYVIDADLK